MKKTLCLLLAVLIVACSFPAFITSYADSSVNLLADASNANGAVTWTDKIDPRGNLIDSKTESVYGGYSWTFGLGYGDVVGSKYEYVNIKATGLKADTKYDFSYIYQRDFIFAVDSVNTANGGVIDFAEPTTSNVADASRAYLVATSFTVPAAGDYTIRLKINRDMRPADCKWDTVVLGDLSLTESTEVVVPDNFNFLENATYANGDVSWTTTTNLAQKIGNIDSWGGGNNDNKTKSVNGGYSWSFGLGDANVNGDVYAYVYIKAKGLTADTRYDFSYIYQKDFIIGFDRVTDKDGNLVAIEGNATDIAISGGDRAHLVSATFKAPASGDYTITLKTNRDMRPADCQWSHTVLSDLVLKKSTKAEKATAEVTVSGNGDATVSNANPAIGSAVTYTAIPWQGEDFLGWYKGEEKVSENTELTVTVTENITLIAKFSSKSLNVLAGKKASDWKCWEHSVIADSTESRNGGKGYEVSKAMYQSIYTTVTLNPNTEYKLSFNWKSAASDKGHSYPTAIRVYSTKDANIEDRTNWIDGGNYYPKNATNLIGEVQYPTPDMAKTEEWQSLATSFTTSGDSEYNLVILFGLTGTVADQVVNLSDFILEDAGGAAQLPAISDKKAADWVGYQWSQVYDSTESRNGGNGFLIKEAMYQNMYTHLTLNPNTEYNLSFEWKAVANSVGVVWPTDVVVVSRNDIDIDNRANWVESDFKYGAFDLENGGDAGSAQAAETLEWQHATTSFTTKGDSEYSLLIHFQAPGNGHQEIYVSDFKLEEKGPSGGGEDEEDTENLAAGYSNAAGNVTWSDNADAHHDKIDKRSDIEGGLSWGFGLASTNFDGGIGDNGEQWHPAYVYIKTDELEAGHKYEFSYIFQKDFLILFDSIDSDAKIIKTEDVKLLEGDRAHRITVHFTATKSGAHTITLKMGKGQNNINCQWDHTVLCDLKLYDITNRVYGKVSSEAGGTIEGFDKQYCTKGDTITLTATPLSGNTFKGWYNENDELVSADTVYTFTAESDFNLIAKYNGNNIPNVDWLTQHGMDGTFENGTMEGWRAEDRDNGDDTSWASFERSTDMAYNGNYSLKFRSRYRTTFFKFTDLKKNSNYKLTFYINHPDLYIPQIDENQEKSEYNEEAVIRWFGITAGSSSLYSEPGSLTAPSIKGGSGWYKVNIFFNTGEFTEAEWNFYYTNKDNAPIEFIYMDDVSLVEYTSNAFENGNFEGGAAPWRGDFTADNGVAKASADKHFYQNVNLGAQSLYTVSFKAKGKGVAGASQITTEAPNVTNYVSSQSAVNIDSAEFKTYSFDVYTGINPDVALFFKAIEGELLVDDITVTKAVEKSNAIVEKVDFESERFALHEKSDVFEIYSGTEGDANVHSGTKSLRFNSAKAQKGVSYILQEAFPSAQIAANTNYKLTLYYKTTKGNSLYLAPEFLPDAGVKAEYTAADNGWTKVEFLFSKLTIAYVKTIIGNIAGKTNADFYIDDITLSIAPPMVVETNSKNKYCEWPLNTLNNQGFEDKITANDWAKLPKTAELRTDKGAAGDNYLRFKAGSYYVLPVKLDPSEMYYFSISSRLGSNSKGFVGVASNPEGTKFYADMNGNVASKINVDTAKWSRDAFLFSTGESGMVYLVFSVDNGYIDVDEVCLYKRKYGKEADPNDHTKFIPYDYDNPDPSTVVLNGGDPSFSGNEETEEESGASPETGDSLAIPALAIAIALLSAVILLLSVGRTDKDEKGGNA